MASNEVVVGSWTELHERLYEGAWQERIGRFRSHFAFRGLSCSPYELSTGLIRLAPSSATLEEHLLRNFRKYAHRTAVPQDSLWNWLSVAQHHGLPTRLLDWTFSPYVALHFATARADKFHEDGVIWAVDYVAVHRTLPHELRRLQEEVGADVFTVEMLDRVMRNRQISSLREFDRLAPEAFLLFFEPPSLDDRIVNQYALFSVVSSPAVIPGDWLRDHPEMFRRIVIPARLKGEVRDKLDQANVSERVLFPGLDGLSAWLRRHYGPASR